MSSRSSVGAEACATSARAIPRLSSVRSSRWDNFKIVVTVPTGEDMLEAQQLSQNDNHDDDHEEEEEEGNEDEDDED
jgi:hypothetical protein